MSNVVKINDGKAEEIENFKAAFALKNIPDSQMVNIKIIHSKAIALGESIISLCPKNQERDAAIQHVANVIHMANSSFAEPVV